MKKTLAILNELQKKGLIEKYAIGGGIAVLFYVEPIFTSDLDIFCLLPVSKGKTLISLSPIYSFLKKRGYEVLKELVVIEGVPVQFIPAYNELTEDSIVEAEEVDYNGIKTRVVGLEHLLAIMLQTRRPKDQERILLIFDEAKVRLEVFNKILKKHNLTDKWLKFKKSHDKQ